MKIKLEAIPHPLEFDPKFSAVAVVDMQNAFTAKDGVFDRAGVDISHCAKIIGVVQQVLDRAREAGMAVLYLQMGYKEDLSDSGGPNSPNWHKEFALVLSRDAREARRNPLIEGTWDFAIVDALKPNPGDLVVRKSRYSGFAGTALDSMLRTRKIQYLFFTGIATNVCVESTLRDAFFLDYWPVLITDATMQAGPDYLQQATVHNVENHFGWTTTASRFISGIESAITEK